MGCQFEPKAPVCVLFLMRGSKYRMAVSGPAPHTTTYKVSATVARLCTSRSQAKQVPEGIYFFADTLGIVAKSMTLCLEPFDTDQCNEFNKVA